MENPILSKLTYFVGWNMIRNEANQFVRKDI